MVNSFSKAFDSTDHVILLKKLSHYGVRGIDFRATLIIKNSVWRTIEYHHQRKGLSVVSRRGPYLVLCVFFIYINDLCLVCKHAREMLFADNTNLFSSGKDLRILESTTNSELSNISLWLKVNKLPLNIERTHYMIILLT